VPVVGIPLDDLQGGLGEPVPADELENELHRFGCSVEGWARLNRFRCPRCHALIEAAEHEPAPSSCDQCGAELRGSGLALEAESQVDVLRMELLAVRPDLFDPPGLARAMRGFRGLETGAPRYRLREGSYSVDVDPDLAGPDVVRPRIVVAVVRGVTLDDARLRSLMKLQENVHWALGRDRRQASIGVYDLSRVRGERLRYRAVGPDEVHFVPLGYDVDDPASALTPAEVLDTHPKGVAFARLLAGCIRYPLFEDGEGQVLSMPPIINSEATRVTGESRNLLIDVTGIEDRKIERALNIVVTSLLEACPAAEAESVEIRHAGEPPRRTPDFTPQRMTLDAARAARLIGIEASAEEVAELLRRMRCDARTAGQTIEVEIPAWRADVMHERDLVEDIAIAYGYDRLPEVHLTSATYGRPNPREVRAGQVRQVLAGMGCVEVMTLALTSEEATYRRTGLDDEDRHVVLERPISVDQTMLRVSLIPGLMETLALNLGHPYPQSIFEVGPVVLADPASPTGTREEQRAGIALAGDGLGYADARSLLDALLGACGTGLGEGIELRGSELALFLGGRGAELVASGSVAGRLGEVHPDVLERYRIVHPVVVMEVALDHEGLRSG
jgi:phenylalanyl-tRNA synthetase beta chain